MKILRTEKSMRPVWSREDLNAAIEAGWDEACVDGRMHLTKVIGTTDTMAVLKEQNGKITLAPFPRIIDMYAAEGVPA